MSSESAPKPKGRLQYLDILRGVAALTVTATHILETGLEHSWKSVTSVCNLGLFGVLLFFIISGLVITASVVKADSIKSFWVGRFWRLFPLYWASLIFSAILFAIFPDELRFPMYGNLGERPVLTFLANMTMLQHFLKFDHYVVAYWTLCFEMVFYISLSILAVFKKAEKGYWGVWLVSAYLLLTSFVSLAKGQHLGFFNITLCGFFCLGIWTYQQSRGQISDNKYLLTVGLFASSVALAWYANGYLYPGAATLAQEASRGPWGNLVAYLGAISLFLVFHYRKKAQYAVWLQKLGLVSYSLYLAHTFGIRIGARIFDPHRDTIAYILVASLLTAVFTLLGYKLIEVPCLNKIKSLRPTAGPSPSDGLPPQNSEPKVA